MSIWIPIVLVLLILDVAVFLWWHSRKRLRMLQKFMQFHQLYQREQHVSKLNNILDELSQQPGMTRKFSQVSTPIDALPVLLFTAQETLKIDDTSIEKQADRICATFPCNNSLQSHVILHTDGSHEIANSHMQQVNEETLEQIKKLIQQNRAQHNVSLSIYQGHGLIYLEADNKESLADINTLYRIAEKLSTILN